MQALSVARAVRSLINVEFKFHDVDVAPTPDSAGTISNLSLIAQGDGPSTRDGNSILLKSIYLRLRATINAAATNTVVRCILFTDYQQQGTLPTVANVLTGDIDTPLNIVDYPKRFRVIRDFMFSLSNSGDKIYHKDYYIKMYKHHIKYDGSGATAAEQRTGNIYLLLISNEGANTPTLNVDSRLRYIDN